MTDMKTVKEALERIARPLDCGCVPCVGQCRSEEALQISVDEMQAEAREALATLNATENQELSPRAVPQLAISGGNRELRCATCGMYGYVPAQFQTVLCGSCGGQMLPTTSKGGDANDVGSPDPLVISTVAPEFIAPGQSLHPSAGAPSREAEDYYPSHEALHDLVSLISEHDALNGGGPGWGERWKKAVINAEELVRVEP